MNRPSHHEIIELLGLKPLVGEGGLYRNTFVSPLMVDSLLLPPRYHHCTEPRPMGTAIFYLLTSDSFSHLHRLKSDEIYHFYLGDPVELLELNEPGSGRVTLLGQDITKGMKVQHLVPHDTWQGLKLMTGGSYALLGTTMAPGYFEADYHIGQRDDLLCQWPNFRESILSLTGDMIYQ